MKHSARPLAVGALALVLTAPAGAVPALQSEEAPPSAEGEGESEGEGNGTWVNYAGQPPEPEHLDGRAVLLLFF